MIDAVSQVTVVKRDGSKQSFDPEKIMQVVEAAGLEVPQSVQLAQSVKEWVQSLNRTEITSLEIRDKISEILKQLNPQVADLFGWYQKTKD